MTVEPIPAPEIRDWQLERYALGELPAHEARAVREALARDEGARTRLHGLEESNGDLLRRYPPAVAAAAIRAADPRMAPEAPRARPRVWPALAAAAAAVVMGAGVVALVPKGVRDSEPPDVTRVKGVTPYLLVYRKAAADEIERLQPGTLARDHDQVQLAYQAAGRRYGVIVSVDGRGVVTRHLPVAGPTAVELKPGPPVPLPQSYELDDAPGFERFYLVTADEPFPVDRVLTAVRRRHDGRAAAETPGYRLELPPSMDQFSFALEKETER
jgi:hypothetical protein